MAHTAHEFSAAMQCSNDLPMFIVLGAGVEGVMRRCCEQTLRIMRENRESLLTIIEVTVMALRSSACPNGGSCCHTRPTGLDTSLLLWGLPRPAVLPNLQWLWKRIRASSDECLLPPVQACAWSTTSAYCQISDCHAISSGCAAVAVRGLRRC